MIDAYQADQPANGKQITTVARAEGLFEERRFSGWEVADGEFGPLRVYLSATAMLGVTPTDELAQAVAEEFAQRALAELKENGTRFGGHAGFRADRRVALEAANELRGVIAGKVQPVPVPW